MLFLEVRCTFNAPRPTASNIVLDGHMRPGRHILCVAPASFATFALQVSSTPFQEIRAAVGAGIEEEPVAQAWASHISIDHLGQSQWCAVGHVAADAPCHAFFSALSDRTWVECGKPCLHCRRSQGSIGVHAVFCLQPQTISRVLFIAQVTADILGFFISSVFIHLGIESIVDKRGVKDMQGYSFTYQLLLSLATPVVALQQRRGSKTRVFIDNPSC